MEAVGDLGLLALDLDTLFVMSRGGHDVGGAIARDIIALVNDEPPWPDPAVQPSCLLGLTRLLSREAPIEAVSRGIIYRLPNGPAGECSADLISGDEPEGRALAARLARDGMPQAVTGAGFLGVDDFWPPWCVALEAGHIAAVAFAARLGAIAAEVGVYTFPGYRGRGLAAAVTARWSSLPALGDRRLFYSTQTTNRSSQRVADRLGLARLGATLALT
jgi:hypothetical protein